MDELLKRIAAAKAALDNGFSRVGPRLRGDSASEGALVAGADRLIRLADAAALLCRHHHAAEARPVARELADTALALRSVQGVKGAREWRRRVEKLLSRSGGRVRPSLPWAHRFQSYQEPDAAPDVVLEAVVLAMEDALKVLDKRWPGSFGGKA